MPVAHFAATTVRAPGSKQSVANGPFAETREQLGGYFLIEAPDLDWRCHGRHAARFRQRSDRNSQEEGWLRWQINLILPIKLFPYRKVEEPFAASVKHFHLTCTREPATSPYPFATPPGRNGFQPQLNLIYSTGNGNGPYGWGWSLTIPA